MYTALDMNTCIINRNTLYKNTCTCKTSIELSIFVHVSTALSCLLCHRFRSIVFVPQNDQNWESQVIPVMSAVLVFLYTGKFISVSYIFQTFIQMLSSIIVSVKSRSHGSWSIHSTIAGKFVSTILL